MSASNTALTPPSTSTKRRAPAVSTPSAKTAAKPLSSGTRGFLRQMVDNLNTHDPDAPKGRLGKS